MTQAVMLTVVLVEFQVPLHTMDESRSTTYVEKLHSESDCRLDIFDSIKAIMDVPDLSWTSSFGL
jgi:hypothetical protein